MTNVKVGQGRIETFISALQSILKVLCCLTAYTFGTDNCSFNGLTTPSFKWDVKKLYFSIGDWYTVCAVPQSQYNVCVMFVSEQQNSLKLE